MSESDCSIESFGIESVDGVDLRELAKSFATPLYIYSYNNLKNKFTQLNTALASVPHKICYAVKANSNLAILSEFAKLGAGFDIVSGGELLRVLKVGADPKGIVFSGVAKTEEELTLAITNNIASINVESPSELRVISELSTQLNRSVNISFRVNPDIAITSHPHLITGLKTTKFGVSEEEALLMWQSIQENKFINLCGVACHIGSGIYDLEPLMEAYEKVLKIADILKSKGAPIRRVDFGGGMGISYSGHSTPLDTEAFGGMVNELAKNSNYEIILEPGKFLVAEAGGLLTRVLYLKDNGVKKFAILDAGMNDLVRPAMYDAYHRIDLVGNAQDLTERSSVRYDIVGPVCESACYFAKDRLMPHLKEGDLLYIRDAGAYGFSMSSRYNSRKLPAEIMIKEGSPELIRTRDEYSDLWQGESF